MHCQRRRIAKAAHWILQVHGVVDSVLFLLCGLQIADFTIACMYLDNFSAYILRSCKTQDRRG